MNAVRINHNERTIVITKKYAKLASEYNAPAYKELRKIKSENPNYQVIVREVSKKSTVPSLSEWGTKCFRTCQSVSFK